MKGLKQNKIIWSSGLHLGLVTIMFGTVLFMKSRSGPDQKAKVSLPLFLCLALYSVAPFAHWVSLSHLVLNTNITNTVISLILTNKWGLNYFIIIFRCSGGCCSLTLLLELGFYSMWLIFLRLKSQLEYLIYLVTAIKYGTSSYFQVILIY